MNAPASRPIEIERLLRGQWTLHARAERDAGGVLLALWASDERDRGGGGVLRAAFLRADRLRVLELPVGEREAGFPSLAPMFPSAARMERAVQDLLGLRAEGGDARPWLRHAAWPDGASPLRRDFDPARSVAPQTEDYAFVRVEGEGVHEIPVGPVHAGIIEPGHFRFSVVGEKVLRLEQRLGYVHKGIEKRLEQLSAIEGRRLAARVSGDSAVAYSWAYCQALETLAGATITPRGAALRAIALERERIANHLGDLGALGNDAGFAFGLSQFMRLKEDLLRVNQRAFGARYLMDYVLPGGVGGELDAAAVETLLAQTRSLEAEVRALRAIYDDHAGVQDRFRSCGIVTPELARELGLIGLAARASGQARDLRADLPCSPYDRLGVQVAMRSEGDVAARVAVRFDETLESLRLCWELLQSLPSGAARVDLPQPTAGIAYGLVEGWRGPILVALETGPVGSVRRCHPHDPSWQNWPLLEHAVIGNIVPDFPLINKSFNLSYSGQDL
ncbi:NADH-quinone oxidoreductase subunit C [Fontimonas sp. SYSU GA230001]|uniref:hydrogenase large subunit n=1 Tax=Fontimonas sp. SYSU GA230001 TaxID=3142450 RepID=UPI0032B4861C